MIDRCHELKFRPIVVSFRSTGLYFPLLFSCFRDINYAILLTSAVINLLV